MRPIIAVWLLLVAFPAIVVGTTGNQVVWFYALSAWGLAVGGFTGYVGARLYARQTLA